ncbi:hypothetical protein JTE90_023606 [Oedothorax gibbosus]|uniref:Uncharacterized protein n=1 Tax=Oedothorax gibbosus TaxID=931172 RepID=A0AAV6UDE5_9ARAC|nr:hypothetical protein JTE90_023606 [Oedothorax gibbosus]
MIGNWHIMDCVIEIAFIPVDVEGQEVAEGCRSSNIRENDPPSARTRENKRTRNHYKGNQKGSQHMLAWIHRQVNNTVVSEIQREVR